MPMQPEEDLFLITLKNRTKMLSFSSLIWFRQLINIFLGFVTDMGSMEKKSQDR
jgi:hypothetical protein